MEMTVAWYSQPPELRKLLISVLILFAMLQNVLCAWPFCGHILLMTKSYSVDNEFIGVLYSVQYFVISSYKCFTIHSITTMHAVTTPSSLLPIVREIQAESATYCLMTLSPCKILRHHTLSVYANTAKYIVLRTPNHIMHTPEHCWIEKSRSLSH